MLPLLVSSSIAACATAIFAFRYSMWTEPWRLLRYFAILFAIELAVEHWVMPPGALGLDVALVMAGITAIFIVASLVQQRLSD